MLIKSLCLTLQPRLTRHPAWVNGSQTNVGNNKVSELQMTWADGRSVPLDWFREMIYLIRMRRTLVSKSLSSIWPGKRERWLLSMDFIIDCQSCFFIIQVLNERQLLKRIQCEFIRQYLVCYHLISVFVPTFLRQSSLRVLYIPVSTYYCYCKSSLTP